jgi:hypothetical protein
MYTEKKKANDDVGACLYSRISLKKDKKEGDLLEKIVPSLESFSSTSECITKYIREALY